MTKLIDLPIGETFDYKGTKLEVIEDTRETLHCSGCYFNFSHEGCSEYLCSSGMREDGKEVIFKAVPLESELKNIVGKLQEGATEVLSALSDYQKAHLAYCKADREYQTAAEEAEQADINYQNAHTRLTDTMSALSEAQRLEKEKLQALNRLLEE